jgi:hypothetical protein
VIRAVSQKTGRSGTLAFVTVGYTVRQDGRVRIEEEQDIVYREPGAPYVPGLKLPRRTTDIEPIAGSTSIDRLLPESRSPLRATSRMPPPGGTGVAAGGSSC